MMYNIYAPLSYTELIVSWHNSFGVGDIINFVNFLSNMWTPNMMILDICIVETIKSIDSIAFASRFYASKSLIATRCIV